MVKDLGFSMYPWSKYFLVIRVFVLDLKTNNIKKLFSAIDLALLSMCDHIIISHGTFGLWAAFLASSKNTHIMAQITSDKEDSSEVIEEIAIVKQANVSNFIFMHG